MNQPAMQKIYQRLLTDAQPVTEDMLIKTASEQGFTPAQLEMLAQIHNSASTIAHFRDSGNSEARGDTFPIIDVPGVVSKYAALAVPVKDHPPLEPVKPRSARYPAAREIRIILAEEVKTASVNTQFKEVTNVGEFFESPVEAVAEHCPNCGSSDIKTAGVAVSCYECAHGLPDEIRIPVQIKIAEAEVASFARFYKDAAGELEFMLHKLQGQVGELTQKVKTATARDGFQRVQRDVSALYPGDALCAGALVGLIKTASDVEFDENKHPKLMIPHDTTGAAVVVKKLAEVLADLEQTAVFAEGVANIVTPRLEKLAAELSAGNEGALVAWDKWKTASAPPKNPKKPKTNGTPSNAPSNRKKITAPPPALLTELADISTAEAERKARVEAAASTLGKEPAAPAAEKAAPVPVNAGGGGAGDPPEEEPEREASFYLSHEEDEDAPSAPPTRNVPVTPGKSFTKEMLTAIPTGAKSMQQVINATLNPKPRDTSKLRMAVRDAQTAVNVMRLMRTDDVISKADPNHVLELMNDILSSAPDIGMSPSRLRAALREAVGYDTVTVDSLSAQSGVTADKAKAEQAAAIPKPGEAKPVVKSTKDEEDKPKK